MEACKYEKEQRRMKDIKEALLLAQRSILTETGSGARIWPSKPMSVQAESAPQISGSSKVCYL
jgi:hypothetical protein